ncbi:P pilus assembly chaperone PapD [Mangrovibacter plantisponsor]|uniref:P pilus assembly chaperone PapD n=2 Tax=Mangrovibacter plantisponsor TaxID=451513 RepID=A0A317PZV4_9ENTR|nr:P pilus assembly chaperone PapD [Mangrovibacter plantisponsor]
MAQPPPVKWLPTQLTHSATIKALKPGAPSPGFLIPIMKKLLVLLTTVLFSQTVLASVVINQTRVIYPAAAKFVSVQLVNDSDKTHLVQSWLDNGDASAAPEKIKVPFTIMPPVVKMAGHAGQTLKISSMNTTPLPKDRESVFWLNVLDVPPIPEGSNDNYLQVAIRNRIKLFYRPESLAEPDSSVAEKISVSSSAGHTCLKNDSPYYMTIPQVVTWQGGELKQIRKDNLLAETAFIAPFGCTKVSDKVRAGGHYRITWLDDFGAKRFSTIN